MKDEACVVWIDEHGKFQMEGFTYSEEAEEEAEGLDADGYRAMVIYAVASVEDEF